MRLLSSTHALDRLEKRLAQLLASPPAPTLPSLNRTNLGLPPRRRWWQQLGPRLAGFYRSWQAHGHSVYWLVQRVPGLRDVVNLAWALLTIQGRLYRLQLAIQETQTVLKQHQQIARGQWQQLERQTLALGQRCGRLEEGQALLERGLALVSERLDEAQRDERAFMQRELELLAARVRALGQPAGIPAASVTAEHRWYLDFEDQHRGSPETIRERQQLYLPYLQAAFSDPQEGWVLDLGCGRGEWLAVLTEAGYKAEGVDNNPNLVSLARQSGLRVHQADLFEYLHTLPDQSYAAVTAFQLIEHLPLAALLELFAESRRILRPGGVIILETPNPENLQVGAYSFWLDPTHIRPLPPPLLAQLARYFGFVDIRIERLNPWPHYRPDADDPLNKLLYCEQDYALIARAPH